MSEELTVTIDPDKVSSVRTVTTDERGRAYLGTDLADSEVSLAILDTNNSGDEQTDE